MINWISDWSQGIIISIIIGTIIEMILPEGNSKKYVKAIIGVYVLISIISPIVLKFTGKSLEVSDIINLNEYIESIEKNSKENDLYNTLDMNNSDNIKEIYINSLKNDIKNKLYDKGYETKKIDLEIEESNEYSINNMYIELEKTEDYKTNDKKTNINVEEIKIGEQNDSVDIKNEISKDEIESIKKYLNSIYEVNIRNININ